MAPCTHIVIIMHAYSYSASPSSSLPLFLSSSSSSLLGAPFPALNMGPALYDCSLGIPAEAIKTCQNACGSPLCQGCTPPESGPPGLCPTNVSTYNRAWVTKTIREMTFGYEDPQLAVAHGFLPSLTPSFFPGAFHNTTEVRQKKAVLVIGGGVAVFWGC